MSCYNVAPTLLYRRRPRTDHLALFGTRRTHVLHFAPRFVSRHSIPENISLKQRAVATTSTGFV